MGISESGQATDKSEIAIGQDSAGAAIGALTITAVTDPELPDEERIRRLHEGIQAAARRSVESAIQIGELLERKRAQLPRGGFMRWIKSELPFSDRTARRYMQLYETREELTDSSSLSDAYQVIAEIGVSKEDELQTPLQDAGDLPEGELERTYTTAGDLEGDSQEVDTGDSSEDAPGEPQSDEVVTKGQEEPEEPTEEPPVVDKGVAMADYLVDYAKRYIEEGPETLRDLVLVVGRLHEFIHNYEETVINPAMARVNELINENTGGEKREG